MTSTQRCFEALSYQLKQKAKLTEKQFLVYSYLVSISKWNAIDKEKHYYVYKNNFVIKDACKELGISQPTWRSAISKLLEHNYIWDRDNFYIIRFPTVYAPLDINLIKYLLKCGSLIKKGGNIVSIYSVLYVYWKFCANQGTPCEITINQLKKLFVSRETSEDTARYQLILGLFFSSGLIDMSIERRSHNKLTYNVYVIKDVSLKYDGTDYGFDDIQDIINAIEQSAQEYMD